MIKENVLIARKIRKAAKILLSYSEDDVQKKIKDNLKVVTEGRKKFEALLPELHSEYARLEESIRVLKEAQKGIEAKLKAEFKVFDKENGITAAGKIAATTLADIMATGEKVDDIIDSLDEVEKAIISADASQKPSYQSAFETLVSLLNGSEFEKYVTLIKSGFKKNIVEFEKAVGQTNISVKKFNDDYMDEYEKRMKEWNERHPENPLPALKASKNERVAGLKDILGVLGGWVKQIFAKGCALLGDAMKNLISMNKEVKDVNKGLDKILSTAKKIK